LAAGLGDEPALALLLGPPLEQRERVQPDVDALDDAERGIGPFELLAQDREADVVHAGAAVALRDRRAEEALLRHLPEQLAGKAAVLVPLPDAGQDLSLGERPDRLLDQAVLVGEAEVDHRPNASGRDATWWLARRTNPRPSGPDRRRISRLDRQTDQTTAEPDGWRFRSTVGSPGGPDVDVSGQRRGSKGRRPATLRGWKSPSPRSPTSPRRRSTSPRSSAAISSGAGITARATVSTTPTAGRTSTSRTESPSRR